MNINRRLGTWPSFATRPLVYGLEEQTTFSVESNAPAHTSFRLRDSDIDIGFLSPIDYARESSRLVIVPEIALWSEIGGMTATMHFRTGLHDIETIAVDPAFASEIILAKIVLAEEFDVHPQIVPLDGDVESMLERADAALLVGDAALREKSRHGEALDLVETWVQMTSLPYVHGFWCARERSVDAHAVDVLQRARREGTDAFPQIASEASAHREFPGLGQEDLIDYLEHFNYDFPDDAIEGLKEFHHFAFYHGILPDIPEINLFSGETPEEEDEAME